MRNIFAIRQALRRAKSRPFVQFSARERRITHLKPLVRIWTFDPFYAKSFISVSSLLAGPASWTIIAHHIFVHCVLHTTYDAASWLLAKLRSKPMKKIFDIVMTATRYLGSFIKHLMPTALVTVAATI